MTSLKLVVSVIILLASFAVHAEKLIVPPVHIVKMAKQLEHKDFPRAIDIVSLIRVESAFREKAYNPELSKIDPNRRVPPSIGLMQVQGGSLDWKLNMKQGTDRMREYYVKYCNKNVECAIKSYNIGPTNHRKGKCKISGAEYWSKFKKRKAEYIKHNKKERFL